MGWLYLNNFNQFCQIEASLMLHQIKQFLAYCIFTCLVWLAMSNIWLLCILEMHLTASVFLDEVLDSAFCKIRLPVWQGLQLRQRSQLLSMPCRRVLEQFC